MSIHDNTSAYPGYNWTKHVYDIKPTCSWWMSHVSEAFFQTVHFRPFRNLFVSHIALPVKSDIKKPCQQHIQVRCLWSKHESSHWKCLLLLIGRFRIGHTTFRWFPKMYFQFPRNHVDISGRDVTELYMEINSPRSPWQCLKSTSYSFVDTVVKVDWGEFYPPAAGIRVTTGATTDHK